MRLGLGRIGHDQSVSIAPSPKSGPLAHLKNAWPFAIVGFVIGLLASVIVNKQKRGQNVTNRAQLLRRLEEVTVGFVSSRAPRAKTEPASRKSPRDMEEHPRNQEDSNSMWPVKWHGVINEPPRVPEQPRSEPTVPREPALPVVPVPVCESPATPTQPPRLPELLRERGPGGPGDLAPRPNAEDAEPAQEPAPSEAASRMERLRGLFDTVGLANLQRNYGPRPPDEQLPMQQAVPVRSLTMPAEPASIVRVVASDEALLPREFIPVREPKRTSDEATSANLGDEIRILPSRRGQYGSR